MIAIRDAYGDALAELGAKNEKVIVLEADVGSSSKSIVFGKAFPDRYYNVGISELNMNAMAAGFASCGLIPFTNTFAVFMTLRGGDPINSMMGYDNLNVKLAGTYSGLSDSYDGASHHAAGDIAIVRAIPNLTIISVCDAVETKKAVFAAAEFNGPIYLRLSRASVPVIFDDSYDFKIGKGVILRDGTDITLVSTGLFVHTCLEAADALAKNGISAKVVNIHTIKPLDEELIIRSAEETGAILTVEEHSIYGGLGSAVAECCVAKCPVPMEIMGITEYSQSGDYDALLERHGLKCSHIVNKAKELLNRKGK
jgi:transketolase